MSIAEMEKDWVKKLFLKYNAIDQDKRVIKFYRTSDAYGCFSNFSAHPITIDDTTWQTVEHFFQAQKFAGTSYEMDIYHAGTPLEAATLGKDKKKPLREDWDIVRVDIMHQALIAKIEQHDDVRSILLSTGNCTLIEHTIRDSYWADGGDGSGQNMLGKLLMDIRNSLDGYTPNFLLPQWLAHPEIEKYSIGWRMGYGESYIMLLQIWWETLSDFAKNEYNKYFIEPKNW